MKYDPETGTFKNADATGTPKKKLGDEAELQKTKTKDTLSEQEYDLEMGAVNKRLPGRKIEMEDGGVKYTREVELPNGHKWRQRADGGWCRFSKKTCYPKWKQRRVFQKDDSGLKDHAKRHSNLSPEDYLARGKRNVLEGKKVKGGGKYPDVFYYIRKVGNDDYSITITDKKGGILSIDTWSKAGGGISKQKIIDGLEKSGVTTKKNFWNNFE